jgi:hypothetical protein
MSDLSQGPGWWLATDGKWYPPAAVPPSAVPPSEVPQAPQYGAPTGQGVGSTGSNAAAVAALVLGIIAILLGWIFIGLPFAVGGIVCGLFGLKKSKSAGKGKAMSIIGIVLSILAIVSAALVGVGIKKVVDSVDVADPSDYAVTTASCSVRGGFLNASGEITNRTSTQKNFIVGVSGGSFASTTVVDLAAGETKPWTIMSDATGNATCGETTVRNFFSGIDLSS